MSKNWKRDITNIVTRYLDYVDWTVDEYKTIRYLNKIQKSYSNCAFRKKCYQIRRFLQYQKINWADNINPPKEYSGKPKHIKKRDITKLMESFKDHPQSAQLHALILLGSASGLRAMELYQLRKEDIDLENRIVYVNHDPNNGQTTKTGKSRISFFNKETKVALEDFLQSPAGLKVQRVFGRTSVQPYFKDTEIKIKDLRKCFSQEWDRNSGPTSIKKLLMGHRHDVDLKHYNRQSIEDLNRFMMELN